VIGPDANSLVNRFFDFAHRLGMAAAFSTLESRLGLLSGRSVLDLGCGRGRWCKEYAVRGARVTGVDISPEAIELLAAEMPQHVFLSEDIVALEFPDRNFDVVNSVTVLQHMPNWKQEIALDRISRWLKPGGYVVLLENVLAFEAPHVFPHRADQWIEMVEATGLKCVYRRGSNFEVLFRFKGRALRALRGRQSRQISVPSMLPVVQSYRRRMKSAALSALAAASFPVEWACHKAPLAAPTHSVMIFGKPV
jgi:SAM-dependent methyltransferase